MARKMLGEMLLEAHAITPQELERALEVQQASGERLGSILLRLEMVDSRLLGSVLGRQQNVEAVDLREVRPTREALATLRPAQARELGCLPLWVDGDTLAVALMDPRDDAVVAELSKTSGKRIKRLVAPQTVIYGAIMEHYGRG